MKKTGNTLLSIGILFCITISLIVGFGGFAKAAGKEVPKEANIAVIFISPLEDQWNMSLVSAMERIQEEKPHGLNVKFDYTEEVRMPDAERVLKVYAATGKYDIIMAHSNYPEAVNKLRKEFPDILWSVSGWDNKVMGGNAYVISHALQDSGYLLGMIAGMMTKSNKIGVVAPFSCVEVATPINAYYEGAKSVNPEVKLVVSYTESWFDPPKAKGFALAQIATGVDIMYSSTFGILEACKEKGIYAFGHESDQNYLAPDIVLSSSLVYWDPAIKYLIEEWWNHVIKGVPYHAPMEVIAFPMKDGGTDIAPYYNLADKIPEVVKAAVEKKRQEIKNGSFTVPFLPQKAVSTK